MIGVVLILGLLSFIGWLTYLKNQEKRHHLEAKDSYIRDLLARYPTADSLEKLVHSGEWEKLTNLYGKPATNSNRLLVLIVSCLGLLILFVAGAAIFLAINVDDDLIFPAIFLSSIGLGLLVISFILNHFFKKWQNG